MPAEGREGERLRTRSCRTPTTTLAPQGVLARGLSTPGVGAPTLCAFAAGPGPGDEQFPKRKEPPPSSSSLSRGWVRRWIWGLPQALAPTRLAIRCSPKGPPEVGRQARLERCIPHGSRAPRAPARVVERCLLAQETGGGAVVGAPGVPEGQCGDSGRGPKKLPGQVELAAQAAWWKC